MKIRLTTTALAVALAATVGFAQTEHGAKQHRDSARPYAGQQTRAIASLSAQDVEDFMAGRGMGLAKSAELNGYPGPLHVLELDKELNLTAEQRRIVQAAFERMQEKAKELGSAYVEAERSVDAAFKSGSADAAVVAARVTEANRLLGEVRLAHLAAHLEIPPLLTPEQRARYAELRGYTTHAGHEKHKH